MVFNLRTFSFTESDEDDPTPPKSFSLKELRVATHDFSHRNVVGGGDFGMVYRGHLADGSQVVVKRAFIIDQEREENFGREMQVARSVSTHPNVVSLRGFCRTKRELLLVYPLMIHNSLASNLGAQSERPTGPLDWTTRTRIALGAATGLAHLHDQGNFRIMHRHICPHSILLNSQFEAVITGFCSSVIMHKRNVQGRTIKSQVEDSVVSGSSSQTYHCYDDVYVDNHIHGVNGFIAPEYRNTGKCTLKNDVSPTGERFLGSSLDRRLGTFFRRCSGNYVEKEAEGLVRLALLCAHENPSVRPEMSEVVRMLESQFLQRDTSSRSSWSQSECDSTPYYSFPPSPSPMGIAP
ncbi:LRR receptor kinase BAK1-like [Rhodamnia argentea]|uniref:LRR receptor kinase BAK1-like n=1 Tax=Rhodamnia argentea TaxID=178133 RepID=A0ABM3HPM8_9MYRT|nr:LRR receptor kinase BAK1-like [Rhodamnia argentea]